VKKEAQFDWISHASVVINAGDLKLITDPWFGFHFHYDTFHCYPPFQTNIQELVNSINAIHISHLHQDHFCRQSLSFFKKDTLVLISEYKSKYFKNQIHELGFTNIIEVPANLRAIDLHGIKIRTIQAVDNETSFDSALIVTDQNDESYLLANDCTFTPDQINDLKRNGLKWKGAFVGYTHISPFPTCFHFSKDPEKTDKLLHEQKTKKALECKLICEELKPDWIVPYANDLRFFRESLHKHNRIFENDILKTMCSGTKFHELRNEPVSPLESFINQNSTSQVTPDTAVFKTALEEICRKASKSWNFPMKVRFIFGHDNGHNQIQFNYNGKSLSPDTSEMPDITLTYDPEILSLFCEKKISWIQLHTTYRFEAMIHNEIQGQSQPMRWRI
jgi:hypothetical protein